MNLFCFTFLAILFVIVGTNPKHHYQHRTNDTRLPADKHHEEKTRQVTR